MQPSKIEIFFAGMFPKIILQNSIVSTIIVNVGIKLNRFKQKIDNTVNTDI